MHEKRACRKHPDKPGHDETWRRIVGGTVSAADASLSANRACCKMGTWRKNRPFADRMKTRPAPPERHPERIPAMPMTVQALAAWLGGEVFGEGTRLIEKAQGLSKAGPHSITFFANDRNLIPLKGSTAGAVLISGQLRNEVAAFAYAPAFILVEDPKDAFVRVVARLAPRRTRAEIGTSPQAFVSPTAR